jgi:mono/diheme cytochrome c family protein
MYKKLIMRKLLLLAISNVSMALISVQAEIFQDDESVASEYVNSCAVCHGVGGKGDGPMLSQLAKRPKDLTVLSQENGGSFPETVVYQVIDGRRINLSHGSSEMPVWGNRFRMEDKNEDVVEARITKIIRHIENLQD